jgi:hypothetical protein
VQRLSGMDASFVYRETPSWQMPLDPTPAPGGFDVAKTIVEVEVPRSEPGDDLPGRGPHHHRAIVRARK